MPHGPWPAATHSPSIPGTRPTSGRPSTLCGRAHTRCGPTIADAIPGTYPVPRARIAGTQGSRIRFHVEERRSEGARGIGGDQAEGFARGAAREVRFVLGFDLDLGLLEDVHRWPLQRDADDDAPRRPDRPPRPARIDDVRRPRPRGDDHVLGRQPTPVVQLDPGDPARSEPGSRCRAHPDVHAEARRPRRVCAGRGGGSDRVPDRQTAGRHVHGQRRLHRPRLPRPEEARGQAGMRFGQDGGQASRHVRDRG